MVWFEVLRLALYLLVLPVIAFATMAGLLTVGVFLTYKAGCTAIDTCLVEALVLLAMSIVFVTFGSAIAVWLFGFLVDITTRFN